MIKAAIFVSQDVQFEEFEYPYNELKKQGIDVTVVLSPKKKYPEPTAKNGTKLFWDITAQDLLKTGDFLFDVIVIPGGFAPENMRIDPELLCIVRYNIEKNKIIAAICHGPMVLTSCRNIPKGTRMSCYVGVKHDLENAGYIYDEGIVVTDRNLITCPHYKYNSQFVKVILAKINSNHNTNFECYPYHIQRNEINYNSEFEWNETAT